MSTIRATYVQHGSSAVPNITLNASGQVIVASGIVSSGTFAAPSGSVSAPGIYFNGDSNTGLYSPAADTIAFTEGGVEALRIDSSGRVGIGVSSPGSYNSNANTLVVGNTSSNQGITISAGTASASAIHFADGTTGDESYRGILKYEHSNDRFLFGTAGGNTALTIDSSQRVGIGTTSPGELLALNSSPSNAAISIRTGGAFFNSVVKFNADDTNYAGIGLENTALVMRCSNSSTPTERARIDSSGRLLVGTSTSTNNIRLSQKLSIVNANADYGGASFTSYSGASNGDLSPILDFQRSRGTTDGSMTVVASGDALGFIVFRGADGTNFVNSASIAAHVDGTPGANDMPGRLVFSTTSDSASSPTERVRINAAGAFKQSVNGSYRSATGSYSEFRQTDGSTSVLYVDMQSNSADNVMLMVNCLRSAASAYSFIQTRSGDMADVEHNLRGDGNGLCDGSWTGGGADYAEYFEWADGNPDAEDRRGISVVLDGGKIREAAEGEDPIGVISGNPSVVGDSAWNKWSGKYMRDDFGSYLLDENGHRQLAPAFDPDQEYIPREERPEWDCVGLMGKLRIRKGQATGSRWIKMRDISDSVEEWLVR